MDSIVCISHLNWNFVWQRPQHLLSRLSKHYKVIVVEEPGFNSAAVEPYLEINKDHIESNIIVLKLIQPGQDGHWVGHGDPTIQSIYNNLLQVFLKTYGYNNPHLWLYTPMALEFADTINHSLLIYDVMDQLSAFKGAPADLPRREKELLKQADIVFTGGLSLFQDKQTFNLETHLFPSGVEIEHFARAEKVDNFERPADLPPAGKPLLGYYGVIDERMDLDLIKFISEAKPEWNQVYLGPVVKIDQAELPQAANIFYPGMKRYEELPSYLAHFDVALIPFANNEATRYLSPTKTLEYLAAHKPVVSTAITDVIGLYGEVVRVGKTPKDFVAQIENALEGFSKGGLQKENELLEKYSWDGIAEKMFKIIENKAVAKANRLSTTAHR